MADQCPIEYIDEDWDEVEIINSYAVLMGYLSMAVKGLGYLVLTWTTVVLLGGFVSMLHKKDFWCLTFITLVQTAGVFDAVMNEKLGYIWDAIAALLIDGYEDVVGDTDPLNDTYSWLVYLARVLLASVLTFVQVLVLVVVLCPLAAIYVLGILMAGGISLWRLIEHDYSNSDSNGEASNLVPAMDTLYYLSILQGVLFCYRFILSRTRKRLAYKVASKKYKCDDTDVGVINRYLYETRRGCEKDPSFTKGRNLITVAIDKIGSNSLADFIYGVSMLYTSIIIVEKKLECLMEKSREIPSGQGKPMQQRDSAKLKKQRGILCWQRLAMNYLVLSASPSRNVLQKLLETLDSRGIHDIVTKKQAMTIVERLAFDINLEEFPWGIQHISSMIMTFEEYSRARPYHRGCDKYGCLTPAVIFSDSGKGDIEEDYMRMLLSGLTILLRLATNEKNCRVMSDTRDLISKISAPVTSDLLHHTTRDPGVWSEVVDRSMQVMFQLTHASGETGAKVCCEISSYEEAINTLWRIIRCNICDDWRKQRALSILARLYFKDTESSRSAHFIVPQKEISSTIKDNFVMMLVSSFTDDNIYISSRVYVGGVLSWICLRSGIDVATVIRQSGTLDVVNGLIKVLAHDENERCRQLAAGILENLCTHYDKDDGCHGKLKKALTDAMPEVLGEIIRCADKMHTGKETDHDWTGRPKPDIENQCDGTKEKIERDKEEKEFQASLLLSMLSLCATIYDTMFNSDLHPQLDATSFLIKLQQVVLQQVVLKIGDPTRDNLLLCKALCNMVISMMKYNGGRFIKQKDLESFIEALSNCSKRMMNLDHSMIFQSANEFSTTWKFDRRTLASLMREATELHAMVPSTSESG